MRYRLLIVCLLPGLAAAPAVAQSHDEVVCANMGSPLPPDQVMAACDRLVADTHPRDSVRARAFVWRGTAKLKARQADAALADFSQAVTLDADNFEARFLRAQVRAQQKDYPAALEDYGAAEKLQPRNAAVHFQRSVLYLAMKRYGEAIADADFAGGGGAALLNQRCWARAVAGTELDKARTACDQALWAAPDNAAILDSRGVVGLKQARFQEAWDDFNTITKTQPRNPRALYGRGLAAIDLNHAADGNADIARAKMLDSDIVNYFRDLGLTAP